MIFSQRTLDETRLKFNFMLTCCGDMKRKELMLYMQQAAETESKDVFWAVKWLYANSPLSDWANYAFSIFLNCAKHGIFLYNNSELLAGISEELFLNYVLHIRINEEELCDCRRFFYDCLIDRVEGLSAREAILEVNYWNAENVTYQSTDSRTISPINAYRSAYGRCGEESAFSVNVFRAIGIPARQVYIPRWAHCDDNHAWVEVYCEGTWHFLGACEPEELLDRGWFTNAASRAMVIHSRCFGRTTEKEIISKSGMVTYLNNLKLYAESKRIIVTVKTEKGEPAVNARVTFGILNYSEFFPAAVIMADENGEACLSCGLGSLNIHAQRDGCFAERLIFVPDTDRVELVLKQFPIIFKCWEDFLYKATCDHMLHGIKPTDEQRLIGAKKLAKANEKRCCRVKSMVDLKRLRSIVSTYGYRREIFELLLQSRENAACLMDFLEDISYSAKQKEGAILTISEKDRRDIDPEILREALSTSLQYEKNYGDLFYKYIVCPQCWNEPLSENRRFILEYFSDSEKSEFQAKPDRIWEYIEMNIAFIPSLEYEQIVTLPAGALSIKSASPLSKKILFVSICRALGIPARINPMDQAAEYLSEKGFIQVRTGKLRDCTIIFCRQSEESWQYETDFSLSIIEDGNYRNLDLSHLNWNGNRLSVMVNSGLYRVITDNRLPNGNIYASRYQFQLSDGEKIELKLHKYSADITQMLSSYELDDFKIYNQNDQYIWASELTDGGKHILVWLEVGKEPTEHLLNELIDRKLAFQNMDAELVFLLSDRRDLENEKLCNVLSALPGIKVYFDGSKPNVELLARRLYVDPEKLPLIIITNGRLNAVYAYSGYCVNSSDMLLRICKSVS